MRANPFESQLERLARTLTEQFGVKVVCQGDNAWTDGKQILLPSLPEPIDEGLERMMVGYLDHEMAHVAFSDFGVAGEFEKKHPGCLGLLNVVEDALIERRAMDRWPGVRANLDAMFAQIRGRVAQLIWQRGPFERFCTAVYLKLAHYGDMLSMDRYVAGYEDLLDQLPQLQTTLDSSVLADQLLKRWQSRNAPPPSSSQRSAKPAANKPSPRSGSTSAPDSGKRTEAEETRAASEQDSGAAESKSDPSQSPADDSSTPEPDSSAGETDGDNTAGASTAPEQTDPQACAGEPAPAPTAETAANGAQVSNGAGGTTRPSSSLITEALAEAIKSCVASANGSTEYRVFTKEYDHIDVVPVAAEADVQALLGSGKDTVRRLRRGLANALRSAEKRWWRGDQIRGDLSPRTLYKLCTERVSLDVFRTRALIQGKSTAVSIVLDASGSMTSREMNVARDAMRVLLEALADLRIATEAFTFTTGDKFSVAQACQASGQEPPKLQDRFNRFSNLEIGLIKRFEEPVKLALSRLPSVRGSGLTPLGEAMQIGAARLIVRPENRKIMLVLTDGKAGCEGNGEACTTHAQRMAERITKTGIELVGVGIQDDSLRAIVADTIVIQQLTELPAQLCKLLGRTLRKGLCHVR